jgi:hypothetical protein
VDLSTVTVEVCEFAGAFLVLRQASWHLTVELRNVARDLVGTGEKTAHRLASVPLVLREGADLDDHWLSVFLISCCALL